MTVFLFISRTMSLPCQCIAHWTNLQCTSDDILLMLVVQHQHKFRPYMDLRTIHATVSKIKIFIGSERMWLCSVIDDCIWRRMTHLHLFPLYKKWSQNIERCHSMPQWSESDWTQLQVNHSCQSRLWTPLFINRITNQRILMYLTWTLTL